MMATPAGTLGDASKGLGRQLYIALAPTYPVQGRWSLVGKGGPHCGRNSHGGSTTPSANYYATAVRQGADTAAAGPLPGGQVVSTVSSENRGLSATTTSSDHRELASVIPMLTSSLTKVGYPEDKGIAK